MEQVWSQTCGVYKCKLGVLNPVDLEVLNC